MKTKFLVIFKNQSNEEFIYRNKNLVLHLIKNFKDIQFINLNSRRHKKRKNTYDKYFVNFVDFNDLKKFLGKKFNFICIVFLEKHFENLKYFSLFKQKKIFLVEIFRGGELKETKYHLNLNLYDLIIKIYKILIININFLIFSICNYLKIIPKTNILFHYNKNSEEQIGYCFSDAYNSSISFLLKKIFFNTGLFFKKVHLINTKSQDELNKVDGILSKYIVFLDSCYDHKDRAEYDKAPNISHKINYYMEIRKTFKNVKNFIFCSHPNSNLKELKKYLGDIKIVKFKTRYYIKKSKLVFFHESSSILDAIYLNKNIILLNSNYLGKYFKSRGLLYSKLFNLKTFNLSRSNDRSTISELINNRLMDFKSSRKVIYSINSKKSGLLTIIDVLKNL